MDYSTQERLKQICTFLKESTYQQNNATDIRFSNTADLLWDPVRFWGKVLHHAKPPACYFTWEDFLNFKKSYEDTHNETIDESFLFSKFWIRNVLGFIDTAEAIDNLVYTFQEIRDFKNEILFWIEFQKVHKDHPLNTMVITDAIEDYETKTGKKLNKDGLYFGRWYREKDGKIELSNFEIYFQHFITYFKEFSFLQAFKNEKYAPFRRKIKINSTKFENILLSFRNLHPQGPDIETLEKEGSITKEGTFYSLSPSSFLGDVGDQISAYAWEMTVGDSSFEDDMARVKNWLVKNVSSRHWPTDLSYSSADSVARFLDAAYQLLVEEPDLNDFTKELNKIYFEDRHGTVSLQRTEAHILEEYITLSNNDHFELLHGFLFFKNRGHSNGLLLQPSRILLALLIRIIVRYDMDVPASKIPELERANQTRCPRIIGLINQGLYKPYLLWKVTYDIIHHKQEVIPYLVFEEKFATTAFILIDELEFKQDKEYDSKFFLWENMTILFLTTLSRGDLPSSAKKILQLFCQLNDQKYQIPFDQSITQIKERNNHEKKEKCVLSLIENCRQYETVHNKRETPYLFPIIFEELTKAFKGIKLPSFYRNGTVTFPLMKWDGITWLLRTSTYWKYKDQVMLMKISRNKLAAHFLNDYLDKIQIKEIITFDHFKRKDELGLPSWSEKLERLRLVDWLYPIYFIDAQGLLNRFLQPDIPIKITDSDYDKNNKFNADKLRTHIGVLLQVLKKLASPTIPYGFDKKNLLTIKTKIEQQIIDYLKRHIKDAPTEGRVDLFEYSKEKAFQSSDKEALFPQITRSLKWFADKDTLIDSISETGDIGKMLTLLETNSSEGIKHKLIAKIKQLDIKKFLENYSWIPEVQYTLTGLAQHPELMDQIDEAIAYWKEKIMLKRSNKEYKMVLYRTELLRAYFRKDEKRIAAIEEPSNTQNNKDIPTKAYKDFYIGLLFIQTDPKKSHSTFDRLTSLYPLYISFPLNRMVAKINWAQKDENISLYREALEEWNATAVDYDKDTLENADPNLSISKLTILSKIGEPENFDKHYRNLPIEHRMNPELLYIVVESLVSRSRLDEAQQLINEAKSYHAFSDFRNIQFVQDLQTKIDGIDNVDELRSHYLRIFASGPAKFIKILPENLNGKIELTQFLVQEFILAADKMLEKIQSISEIKDEDKYNDLIELVLNARINPWGWRVGAQSRGAFSGSGGYDPGERDLPILDINNKVMVICEAWIFRDKTKTHNHLAKIFNYHHKKEAFVVLVYDTGQRWDDFQKSWDTYLEEIQSAPFPTKFAINGPSTDVTSMYGFSQSAIKVAACEHGTDTTIYHIFINTNYKLFSGKATLQAKP